MTAQRATSLDAWFLTPQGRAVAQAWIEHLTTVQSSCTDLRGGLLLQIGACGDNLWLTHLPYRRKFIIATDSPPQITAQPTQVSSLVKPLPFAEASADCIVAPMTLETIPWSNHPLDEIDRILKPMGYLLLLSVNVWSLWGLAMRLGGVSCFSALGGRGVSIYRLKRALIHRGYTIHCLEAFHYIPPVMGEKMIERLVIFNEFGKMVTLFPGGFYGVVAQKYVPDHLLRMKAQMKQEAERDLRFARPTCPYI